MAHSTLALTHPQLGIQPDSKGSSADSRSPFLKFPPAFCSVLCILVVSAAQPLQEITVPCLGSPFLGRSPNSALRQKTGEVPGLASPPSLRDPSPAGSALHSLQTAVSYTLSLLVVASGGRARRVPRTLSDPSACPENCSGDSDRDFKSVHPQLLPSTCPPLTPV